MRTQSRGRRTGHARLFAFGLSLALAAIQPAVSGEWIPLFNGKDLTQWQHVGPGGFEIEEGLLKTEGGMGLLWYTGRKFEDVKLKVVFKGDFESNSGVFIRIPDPPTDPRIPVHRGYEVQIDYSQDEYHVTGVLYSLTKARAKPPRNEGWNEMIITLDGDRTIAEVNGVLITDFREGDPVRPRTEKHEPERQPRPRSGYVGVQNHSPKDTIYFKEISYQPLGK